MNNKFANKMFNIIAKQNITKESLKLILLDMPGEISK
jgi:hypothetical protein